MAYGASQIPRVSPVLSVPTLTLMSSAHWLALSTLPGIGGVTARKLLERFGDIGSAFAASPDELTEIPRVTSAIAAQLLAAPIEALEAELLSLSDEGIDFLTWDDGRYPAHLRALADAPMTLFVRGTLKPDDARAAAIVGTRTPNETTVEVAATLGRELAARGLTVVSGLALGVDTAAHRGALESGRTLAVLGSGIRFVHPKENEELAEQIVTRGALISELHPNTPPRGPQLMARDRIVSGLSRAVIVVEAGIKSGSLDTAAKANKQRRLVFAVPGSEGCEQLLAGGARRLDPGALDFDTLAEEIMRLPLSDQADAPPSQASLF